MRDRLDSALLASLERQARARARRTFAAVAGVVVLAAIVVACALGLFDGGVP